MLQILNLFVEGQRLSNAVCSERTDWQQYNDREKRLVQNTVMLVGLLYKMCKRCSWSSPPRQKWR